MSRARRYCERHYERQFGRRRNFSARSCRHLSCARPFGAPIARSTPFANIFRRSRRTTGAGAYPAQQVSILVSDVPDATPDALASGPTMPDSTSIHDCERIAAKYGLIEQLPKSVADLFRQHALAETPKSDDPAFVRARWWTVLSNKIAVDEAARLPPAPVRRRSR